MPRMSQILSFVALILLLVVSFTATEARPLNTKKWENEARRGILVSFFDGFSLESIKHSGPSQRRAHGFPDAKTLRRSKAGPSPGEGHKYTNVKTQEGPSPGEGHKYTGAQARGGIKAGPSPGEGHKYSNVQTLGGIKEGPSPGEGHKYTNAQTLGGTNEGPSPGEGH